MALTQAGPRRPGPGPGPRGRAWQGTPGGRCPRHLDVQPREAVPLSRSAPPRPPARSPARPLARSREDAVTNGLSCMSGVTAQPSLAGSPHDVLQKGPCRVDGPACPRRAGAAAPVYLSTPYCRPVPGCSCRGCQGREEPELPVAWRHGRVRDDVARVRTGPVPQPLERAGLRRLRCVAMLRQPLRGTGVPGCRDTRHVPAPSSRASIPRGPTRPLVLSEFRRDVERQAQAAGRRAVCVRLLLNDHSGGVSRWTRC